MELFEKNDKRTHYCGTLSAADTGKRVCVLGWCQRQRDLGGLIFIDLRDRTGIVQLAFDENTEKSVLKKRLQCAQNLCCVQRGQSVPGGMAR